MNIGNNSKNDSENSEMKKEKIILIGLDNSGKTSILHALIGDNALSDFTDIAPTNKIQIRTYKTEENEYYIWDFGGQEKYREDHIKNLPLKAEGLTKLIYVIDIQDFKRYDLALEYLRGILESGIVNERVSFSVFLHKFDTNLEQNREHEIHKTIPELEDKIRKICEKYKIPKIFKTSLYVSFRKIPII